mmetsp:Transcript_4175/g.10579  ORF Transcript_4175/g.10579 Transcript_4175/m.10579 type:complete len:100 (-) Transcript_4175:624-923(-)
MANKIFKKCHAVALAAIAKIEPLRSESGIVLPLSTRHHRAPLHHARHAAAPCASSCCAQGCSAWASQFRHGQLRCAPAVRQLQPAAHRSAPTDRLPQSP